ncbi:MAG: DUF1080 domain-containing protein [Planctomycetes bacterium]|nr:DUF1080 domain-containing protein [Planctomycetota bacterium]
MKSTSLHALCAPVHAATPVALALLAFSAPDAAAAPAQVADVDESAYYSVDYLVPPDGSRVEVGGMDFLPDGRLVVSTRRGQVWLVSNPLAADPKDAKFALFAEGLQEGLGLRVVDGKIHLVQRSELSVLSDTDGDDRCDRIDTLCDDWGVSGHYHEFAFGLPRDPLGNFYVSLNVSFGDPQWWHGRSTVPYRGWVVQISPDGKLTPFASGFRSPAGIGANAEGEIFVTENQGDWMPACPLFHVEKGGFYGHPASLAWTDEYVAAGKKPTDTDPPDVPRKPAALWIPYDWARSAAEMAVDSTGGKFGPFAGQMFISELTNGLVLRADLERVQGVWQGAILPFRQHVGSAVRLKFADDGTLFCGFTDRGWGGQAPGDGIARIRWTKRQPLEIEHVRLVPDGLRVEFTKPLAETAGMLPAHHVQSYDYDYWWEYGSPVRHAKELTPANIAKSADGKALILGGLGLEAGTVVRVKLGSIVAKDGTPLLHDEFAYTINQLVDGPRSDVLVAKRVEPPAVRERWEEGMLFLTDGDALDAWRGDGWRAARSVELDGAEPRRLAATFPKPDTDERGFVLTNVGADAPAALHDLESRFAFGDVDLHVDFMLPKDGNSGIYLMGRYEVQLRDSAGKSPLESGDCGGIYAGEGFDGSAPLFQGFRGAGEWHGLDIRFRAPRFDASGKKIANAKFERVLIDDVLLQENVEVPGPTHGGVGGPGGEVAFAPLRIQGDHGPVAIRGVRVRAKTPPDDQGWTRIFNGKNLDGWQISDGGKWKVVDGAIVGTGPASHLFSPRGDYRNVEFRAKVKINGGGNSGMYFRAAFGPGWPAGYEAQVNSTFPPDPQRTGSFYNHVPIKTRLVPPDTWFTQHVICRDEADGVRVIVEVNDVVVVDTLDKERKFASGHVALQQHHDGSVVTYKDLEIRELP